MNVLATTFWGEGISDERFLPGIAQRVIETLLQACAKGEWEVYEPQILKTQEQGFVQQVLDIAMQSAGFTVMFIHTDADARDENEKALPNKIAPALESLRQKPAKSHCQYLVPIIPVTKIENWKLADGEALRNALGINLTDEEMNINIPATTLEQRGSSKDMLQEIMSLAKERSRFAPEMDELDASLSNNIRFERLMGLKSFRTFVDRLRVLLVAQNIIAEDCEEMVP